jgi:hypothetical protein
MTAFGSWLDESCTSSTLDMPAAISSRALCNLGGQNNPVWPPTGTNLRRLRPEHHALVGSLFKVCS